jgi:hypothetical protein
MEFSMNLMITKEFSPVFTLSPVVNGVAGAAFVQSFPSFIKSTVPTGL